MSWGFHQTMPLFSKYSVATFLACFGTLVFINWRFTRYTFLMKGISDASNISVSFMATSVPVTDEAPWHKIPAHIHLCILSWCFGYGLNRLGWPFFL